MTLAQSFKQLIGLSDGQRREQPVPSTKGSGWYDGQGVWLGWGDLTQEDMIAMAKTLGTDERIIVLHQEDSYHRFMKAVVPDCFGIKRSEDAPGLDYIAEHAFFVIEQNAIYCTSRVLRTAPEWKDGVAHQVIDCSEAKKRILGISLDIWQKRNSPVGSMHQLATH